MGLFDRFRGPRPRMRRPSATPPAPGRPRSGPPTAPTRSTCASFVATRRGVEGFVEPRTAVSDVTLLLVAHDGEWTRRRVPSVAVGARVLQPHQVPSYDAAVVGVPQRMRDYNRRKKNDGLTSRSVSDARPARGRIDQGGHREAGAAGVTWP